MISYFIFSSNPTLHAPRVHTPPVLLISGQGTLLPSYRLLQGLGLPIPAQHRLTCAVGVRCDPSLKRPAPAAMATMGSATADSYPELRDESDFESLISPDGSLSICGFGSLLSERSAKSTFPDLKKFRMARLHGFRRIFGHTAPVFFDRGIANQETGEISSLSVEPCQWETLVITVFEIKKSEVPSFIEREHEFRFLAVMPEEMTGEPFKCPAVVCARYTDEEYFHFRCKGMRSIIRCFMWAPRNASHGNLEHFSYAIYKLCMKTFELNRKGSKEIYFQRYGRYNIDKIWRDDILPCRVYLRHCVLAAKNLGKEAYDNFLDHTYLGDQRTTIREYLATTGSGIMEEEPPESLKIRYGG